eukprot:5775017-Alexandrium_andersonii.AAC.1
MIKAPQTHRRRGQKKPPKHAARNTATHRAKKQGKQKRETARQILLSSGVLANGASLPQVATHRRQRGACRDPRLAHAHLRLHRGPFRQVPPTTAREAP